MSLHPTIRSLSLAVLETSCTCKVVHVFLRNKLHWRMYVARQARSSLTALCPDSRKANHHFILTAVPMCHFAGNSHYLISFYSSIGQGLHDLAPGKFKLRMFVPDELLHIVCQPAVLGASSPAD